jgi:DinB family protein
VKENDMTALESVDVNQARRYFDQTRQRVVEVTTGLSDAQWRFKPGPERWSIAENLEHMVIVQERVLGMVLPRLAEGPAPAADRDHQRIDAIVLEKIPDRSIKAKAPDFLNPTGQWAPTAALERLYGNYGRVARLVESAAGLREHVLEAPPLRIVTNGAFDTMDGYQWALTLAAHDERHVRQILEVKAHANYPA